MIKFEVPEVLKIAELSALKLNDEEAKAFATQLRNLLEYFAEIQQVETPEIQKDVRMINVFREDKAIPTDSAPILGQAPEREGDYFVVPKILE